MLLCFSRNYLHREGDLVKHLSYLGYTVSHVQTPLQEFDFGVTNLAVDLRDGLRLVYVYISVRIILDVLVYTLFSFF